MTAMTRTHFAEGQVLFREGDPADSVFRLLSGGCTKQCNPVPNVRLFRAPPSKSTHPQLSRSFLYPSVFSKHPNEMGLVCVKTRVEQEPELGIFCAAGGHATCIVRRSSRSMLI